jgi:hypothetical protein
VFENKVLCTVFGPKREEVTGNWRKEHHDELHKLCSCVCLLLWRSNQGGEMGWACSTHGRDEQCIQNFSRKKLKREDNFGDLGG